MTKNRFKHNREYLAQVVDNSIKNIKKGKTLYKELMDTGYSLYLTTEEMQTLETAIKSKLGV